MPWAIDNFDQIKSQLTFGESDNLFLHLQILRKHFPEVEVKKNGLTALYVPQCICEKI